MIEIYKKESLKDINGDNLQFKTKKDKDAVEFMKKYYVEKLNQIILEKV